MTVKVKGLLKRNGVYYYRRVVMPRSLAQVIGQSEIVVSLKTRDLGEAIKLAEVEKKKADARIAAAKKIASNPEQAAQAWKKKALADDLSDRLRHEMDDDRIVVEEDVLLDRATAVKLKLRSGGLTRAEHAHLVAEVDALKVALQRNRGDVDVASDDDENPKLTVLVEKWKKDAKPAPRTAAEWSRAFDRLIAVIGVDVPVRSVTKAHVRTLKEKLLEGAGAGVNGRSRSDASRPANGEGKLKRGSIRKVFSGLKSVFNWSIEQGFIEHNPCDGVAKLPRASVEDMEKARIPYSAADLRIVFSKDTLAYFMATMPGSSEPWRNGRGWLGYVGLLTGCRLAELTGLRREDVVKDEETGIHYLNLVNWSGRRLKTASSIRRVPLADSLAPFIEWAKARPAGPLFPELLGEKRANFASMWWSRWTDKLEGLHDRKRTTFHSLRANFIDGLRRTGCGDELRRQSVGHAKQDVHAGYGSGYDLTAMFAVVNKVSFAGVVLPS